MDREGACRPYWSCCGDVAGEGASGLFDLQPPRPKRSDPINLGAVFTKTVSYDFSNKYIFQSDGVLFKLNASRSRRLSPWKIHRGGNGAGTQLRRHKNLCKHIVIYRLRKGKGWGRKMFHSPWNPQVPALREDTENLIFFFHKLALCYSLDNGRH